MISWSSAPARLTRRISRLEPSQRGMGVCRRSRCKIELPTSEYALTKPPKFNPVDLAVDLLDQKSTGKDIDDFQETKYKLFSALKGTVDSAFNCYDVVR